MRFFLLPILLCLFQFILPAQSIETLRVFNDKRETHQKNAMLTLGSWAAINITGGLILQNNSTGSQKYFHQMNAGWNTINLGIAALGYWRASRTQDQKTFASSWKKFEGYQKSLLFNAGLDMGYVAGGFYLIERSRRFNDTKSKQFNGWGRSIILQGAFLFGFDIVAYLTSNKIAKNVRPYMILDSSTKSAQIGFRINF